MTLIAISNAIVLLDTSGNDTFSRRLSVLYTQCFSSRTKPGNLLLIVHYLYHKILVLQIISGRKDGNNGKWSGNCFICSKPRVFINTNHVLVSLIPSRINFFFFQFLLDHSVGPLLPVADPGFSLEEAWTR